MNKMASKSMVYQRQMVTFPSITCLAEVLDVENLNIELLENCFQTLSSYNPIFRTAILVDDNGKLHYHKCDLKLRRYKTFPEYLTDSDSRVNKDGEHHHREHQMEVTLRPSENNKWFLELLASRLLCDESYLEECMDKVIELYNSNNSQICDSSVTEWKEGLIIQESCDDTYWSTVFQSADVNIDIVCDMRKQLNCDHTEKFSFTFESDIVNKLEDFCKKQNVHPSIAFLALFKTLLYRYSHQDHFCIISSLHGISPHLDKDRAVTETCVECNVDDQMTFIQLIHHSQRTIEESLKHVDYVLSCAISGKSIDIAQRLPRFLYRKSLVGNATSHRNVISNSYSITRSPLPSGLILKITETNLQYVCNIEYNPDSVKKLAVVRMIGHLQTLLEGVMNSSETQLLTLPLLTSKEIEDFKSWNNTDISPNTDYFRIEESFSAVAQKVPNNTALYCGEDSITYERLNHDASSLSEYLSVKISNSGIMAVCMKKSIKLVISMLAIMKAGQAYVLIDPAYPPDRILSILEEAVPSCVVVDELTKNSIPEQFQVLVVTDNHLAGPKRNDLPSTQHKPTPQSVAYLLYTSGTSGAPKGVIVDHSSVLALVNALKAVLSSCDVQGVLISASVGFTLFAGQLYLALLTGNKGILVPSLLHLPNTPSRNEVTLISTPPAGLLPILFENDIPISVRCIMLGGDQVSEKVTTAIQKLPHDPSIKVISTHGCSENVLFDSFFVMDNSGEDICAGKPMPNNKLYIVDQQLQLVPIGVTGELCVSSSQLALGYFKNPELTKIRFVPNPFENASKSKFKRLYRTGDLARRRDNGNIEIIGRMDFQVKINGIRVELEEISSILMQHPRIQKAVVVLRKNLHQQLKSSVHERGVLIAYYSSGNSSPPSGKDLQQYLCSKLPSYMIPTYFVHMDELPHNRNGKIDRSSLPLPVMDALDKKDLTVVLPKTEMEHHLHRLACDLLKRDSLGVTDNLFEVGADSILAVRFVVKILQQFKVELQVRDIFQYPTISGLSTLVECALKGTVMEDNFCPEVDSQLPDDIVPFTTTLPNVENPQFVLLTGATGFIGAFILADIINNTNSTVHCLVRSENASFGLMRIQSNLIKYGIWDQKFKSRLVVHSGDLSNPKLGLAHEDYEWLSSNVDVIYHCAAPVNFVLSYAAVRQETVEGTNEMLRFACVKKLKAFHFVSSVAVHGTVKAISYEDVDLDKVKSNLPTLGYARMKWVSEKLVQTAAQRGLPVTILRPSFVIGHTVTGSVSTSEYISRLIKGCIQLGSFPDINAPLWLVPIDYIAMAILKITTKKENLGKTFHLTPDSRKDVICTDIMNWVKDNGYILQKKTYYDWYEDLKSSTTENSDNALFPLIQFVKQQLDSQNALSESELSVGFDNTNTQQALKGINIECQNVNARVINRMITYLAKEGFLSSAPDIGLQPAPPKRSKIC